VISLKVLVLSNNASGLFGFRKELIFELQKKYDVFVSVPYGKDFDKLENIGCKVIDTKLSRRGVNPFKDLKLLLFYKRLIKSIRPDIVLTYTIKPNIYGAIACRMVKIPYIVNITGLGTSIINKGVLQRITLFLYRFSLMKAYLVYFQNEFNLNFLTTKIKIRRAKLLPGSGVNLIEQKFEDYPSDSEVNRFVTVGRIMKDKGIEELLAAIKTLKQNGDNSLFILLGAYDENYKSLIDDYERKGWLNYCGFTDNVHDYLKKSNAIIHPSYHEGTSNALLEAAACGRPILASNIPGCNNIFDEGVSGFGFEVKNSKAIVEAVNKFKRLPYKKKKEMGINGRKKVEKEFDRNIVINDYLTEINSLLNGE